jgi:hypothetical protein
LKRRYVLSNFLGLPYRTLDSVGLRSFTCNVMAFNQSDTIAQGAAALGGFEALSNAKF